MTDINTTQTCNSCNEALEEGARFCASCGTTAKPSGNEMKNHRHVGPNSNGRNLERPNDLKSWIAIALAPLSVFTCGPLLSIPGAILAGLQLHAIKSGQIAGSSQTLAHFGLWGNVVATGVGILMACLSVGFMGLLFV